MSPGRFAATTVRLIIAIAATPLMTRPTGLLIAGYLNAWLTSFWALTFAAMGIVGVVLAIITGLTSPAKNGALHSSGN